MKLSDGAERSANGQLAGTPSVLVDAIAVVLSAKGSELLGESAASQFVADAFGHLKAIGFTQEAKPLLDEAGVRPDAGVIDLDEPNEAFVEAAARRFFEREPTVRMLA